MGGTLSQRITSQLMGLKGLHQKLQDIFNLLPDVTNPCFVRSLQVNTNDQMLVMYIASLIRSVIALHNLINNKLANKEAEKKEGKKDDVKEKKDDKTEKEKK